jgi:RNA polymerase sigma factor (sigma-70 family)
VPPAKAVTDSSTRSFARARGRFLRDERIANLVTGGEHEAFAVLYERYRDPIYRYCLAILGEPNDARDALQTTMLNAFQSLSNRSEGVAVRPWLYRIAHNTAISLARNRPHHSELPDQLSSERLGVDDVADRELAGRILEEVSELPSRRRAALVMRELQGLRYEEIALALDVTTGAARQAVFEARTALSVLKNGAELDCRDVCARISARDGRRLRSRAVRIHLRRCVSCRQFGRLIHSRKRGLAALPVLAATAHTRILESIVQASNPEAVAALSGAGAKGGGLLFLLKGAATGVAVLTLGAGAVPVDEIEQQRLPPAPDSTGNTDADVARSGQVVGRLYVRAEPARGAAAPTKKSRQPKEPGALLAAVEVREAPGQAVASAQTEPRPSNDQSDSPSNVANDDDRAAPAAGSPPPNSNEPVQPSASQTGASQGTGSSEPEPAHEGSPPGQSGTPPGQGGTTRGQGGTPPGQGEAPPTEAPAGQGETPEVAPGASPGHGGTPPGQGGTPPGQVDNGSDDASSSINGTPPGQGGTPPGQGGTPPGQVKAK